jgi:Ca2+/Na+ antiporter
VPGLKANYYQQNRIFNSPITNLLEDIIEALYTPWKKLFSILPVEKSPFLTFGGIMTICFMITRYNIHTVDRIINYLSLSHTFVGLTFVSWGGNIGGKHTHLV